MWVCVGGGYVQGWLCPGVEYVQGLSTHHPDMGPQGGTHLYLCAFVTTMYYMCSMKGSMKRFSDLKRQWSFP